MPLAISQPRGFEAAQKSKFQLEAVYTIYRHRRGMEQRTLGDYRIIKPIGQGTLGNVYLAEHRFMKRQYAIKILPEELASDRAFIQRFEEEVSHLASLEHPSIVKIYNISFTQGVYFIVMDCIVDHIGETTNLAKYIMGLRRPLEEDELFDILEQIADALDYAHAKTGNAKGFVHRGIKPNNILIGKKKGEKIEVFLSDFGLTRIIGPAGVLTRTYKNVAEAIGIAQQLMQKAGLDKYINPQFDQQKLIPLHASFLQNYAFLSPEQKRLDSPFPIDIKTDVYAFGVLIYFLLMNQLPEGVFDLPSDRASYRYDWDSIIKNCLQMHPQKRPELLKSLLEAIKQEKKAAMLVPKVESTNEKKDVKEESLEEIALKYSVNIEEYALSAIKQEPMQAENDISNDSVYLRPNLQASQLERPQTDLDPASAFQVSSTVKTYNPEPRDVKDIKPLLTEMVVIQGGSFYRGSQDGNRDETPRHQISLFSFAIDIHPVTNEQFVRFLEVMGGEKDSHHNDIIRLRDSRIKRSGGKLSIESGYAKHPVVGVTWYGAVAYAKWIGKRLPTEGEWEIASRGKNENVLYPTGEDIEKSQANFFSSDTTAVMSYAPNGYGLYDMAGNVYEWCHDWYGYNYYEISLQEPENPQGPLQGVYRVLRGGCWKSLKEDLRCSRRHRNNPGTVNGTYGFRCASGVQNQ